MGKRSSPAQQALLQRMLRQLRTEAGLRQEDLAAALGRHQSFVSKYETGERRLDFLELGEICVALGISVTTFARRFEKMLR